MHLPEELSDLTERVTAAIGDCAPTLLDVHGVGPDTAAALQTAAGGNPQRMGSEASFADLCGASPVEASSGKTRRRRLNHGGGRQADSALCTIVPARMRRDPGTRAYVERRVCEGKTRREAVRCLNRYVARETYQTIVTLRPRRDGPRSAG
ncbi:transposase [Streptomyces sp. NPDC047974]|uniref:transposase n=1 Tax=Streptomyces sp. NPDC047974 TaxID=3154343 RepID=UPI0033FB2910